MKKLLIAGAVLVAAGVGYYVMKPGAPGSGASLLSAKSGPLDHVPADTAFVFANVEPMPKAVTQAWMEQFAQVSGIYAMQAKMAEEALAKEDPNGQGVKWMRALAAEAKDRTAEQIMTELGIDMQMRYAMYEVAARPVLRFELADPAKTRAFIARVEQNAGDKVPTAKVDALDYWNFADPKGEGRLVAAIDGSQLVVAFLTSTQDDAALRGVHTTVLVQGDTLGGGLESVLPFHKVIFERSAQAGFPEVLFNLFPGMGAWPLTIRKAGFAVANDMILSGRLYTAEQLLRRSLVDGITAGQHAPLGPCLFASADAGRLGGEPLAGAWRLRKRRDPIEGSGSALMSGRKHQV